MKPTDLYQISIGIAAISVGLAAVSVALPTIATAMKAKPIAPAIGATDFLSRRVDILSAEPGILRDSFPNVFRKMRNTAGEPSGAR